MDSIPAISPSRGFARRAADRSDELEKRGCIDMYIPHIGIALQEILDLTDVERDGTVKTLDDVPQKSRKFRRPDPRTRADRETNSRIGPTCGCARDFGARRSGAGNLGGC